jgi:hypothetical protein
VTNVFNNGEGIDNVGELLSTFGLGTVSGTADWGNMATFGVFHDAAARQSAGAIGLSHNVAWDKSWNDPEAYSVTYDMLSKAYGYGARGSWTKIGGEITLANHFYGELTDPSQRAAEQRNIFAMRTAKINQQDITIGNKTFYFSKIRDASEGNNNIWYNKFGHRFLGKVLGGQLAYYGFEVWGEPYETWQTDDYQDDFWTSDEPPSSFNYWDMW